MQTRSLLPSWKWNPGHTSTSMIGVVSSCNATDEPTARSSEQSKDSCDEAANTLRSSCAASFALSSLNLPRPLAHACAAGLQASEAAATPVPSDCSLPESGLPGTAGLLPIPGLLPSPGFLPSPGLLPAPGLLLATPGLLPATPGLGLGAPGLFPSPGARSSGAMASRLASSASSTARKEATEFVAASERTAEPSAPTAGAFAAVAVSVSPGGSPGQS
mmetsp:Transcript_24641/g.62379  ORF Transcript_24641/g.62379 Transcript_24641/m.62379 type:complete len:218 (+) Transcript_24641:703-1356(+)